jgi:nicotinamide riboside transporter PnuC
MDFLPEFLTTYYGLDWLSSILGLVGLYLVSEKKAVGFLATASAVVIAAVVALMAGQFGFLLANTVTFALALRGYYRWRQSEVRNN